MKLSFKQMLKVLDVTVLKSGAVDTTKVPEVSNFQWCLWIIIQLRIRELQNLAPL